MGGSGGVGEEGCGEGRCKKETEIPGILNALLLQTVTLKLRFKIRFCSLGNNNNTRGLFDLLCRTFPTTGLQCSVLVRILQIKRTESVDAC